MIAPVGGLGLLFWAIRDGFIRQAVTLGSKSDAVTYRGSDAVLIGIAMVAGALLCGLVAYRFWVVKDPIGPD